MRVRPKLGQNEVTFLEVTMFDPNSILDNPSHRQEQLLLEAAWRFQLVAPLLEPTLSREEAASMRQRLLSQKHLHPWRGLVSVSARSLRRWCRAYREHRLKGLAHQPRRDRGHCRGLPKEALERAKLLFAEDPRRTVTTLLRLLKVEKAEWNTIA